MILDGSGVSRLCVCDQYTKLTGWSVYSRRDLLCEQNYTGDKQLVDAPLYLYLEEERAVRHIT